MKINYDDKNEAFVDVPEQEHERILKEISHKIIMGYEDGSIHDINGNKIGGWKL